MAANVSYTQQARKVKPGLLGKIAILPECVMVQGNGGQSEAEEFDFSEVFGPMPSPLSGARLSSISDKERSLKWRPPELLTGRDPVVICSRSHSLVGPSPRPSLLRQLSKRAWEEPNCGDAPNSNIELCFQREITETPRLSFSGSEDSASGEGVEEFTESAIGVQGIGKLGPHDFEFLKVVGQGSFGKVFQVQKKGTDQIYAMKVMRKDVIMERNQGDYMKAERDILTKIVHPFIVQLQYSFQTRSKLYLIFDFINGGHLFFQLYHQGTFSEELARVYTAEIISAVGHLHKNGIIHRDLKPENIILDAEGHVKLTDFGVAKEVDDSCPTNSMCGTMEYMAPEIVLAKGHGKSADWWSVGILLYEMLIGQPPFTQKNRQKLQQKIIKDKVKLPSYLSSEAHSLLKGCLLKVVSMIWLQASPLHAGVGNLLHKHRGCVKAFFFSFMLLQKDSTKRLGTGANGCDEIKQHKWFKPINWRKLEAREIQPNFRPVVNGKACIANFDEVWTKMPVQDSPASTPKDIDSDFFQGFTYVAPNTWLKIDGQ